MIQVLDFFGIPTFGGTVTLECAVRLPLTVLERAGGEPIAIASYVRDTGDAMLIADGPRSGALHASAAPQVVSVPLTIPRSPGIYEAALDAVVERKFWASALGVPPLRLRVERTADGSLHAAPHAGGPPFVVPAQRYFHIPHQQYGAGDSERSVEIPWVLSRYQGERHVLDVGYAFAEPRYTESLLALPIPVLVGIDLATAPQPALRVIADVRRSPFRPETFDLILAVSVIEHIGRDNTIYFTDHADQSETDGDVCAIRALADLLAPGGRLLLTVPFGRAEDHGWFIQYDSARLHALVRASNLALAEVEYFRYGGAWQGPVSPHELGHCGYARNSVGASAIACLTLRRR